MLDISQLERIAGRENIKRGEMLSAHTSFRIGGPADIFVTVQTGEMLVELCRYLAGVKQDYLLLGNGSNLLVRDEGVEGVVVSVRSGRKTEAVQSQETLALADYMVILPEEREKAESLVQQGYIGTRGMELRNAGTGQRKTLILAGAGILLSKLAAVAAEESLTGFEFASGIPGSLGGAVTMNAGAYGGQISDAILGARVLTEDGEVLVLEREELKLGYRDSVIQQKKMIVLDAVFGFFPAEKQTILDTMRELNARRREKQPLEYGSAGSTFKRPEGYFAGKLIEDAGLKGYRVGDIMVSDKHAGFVVNVGNGTFRQAMEVISHVQDEVEKQFGVKLETEVKIV